ncbi:MAG TPA: ATP-dependent DNA helicase RecG [Candidatus Hypogeohydataceae bacterium YC38]
MYTVGVKASPTTENPIYGSLQYLKGVGPWRAQVLGRMGLFTIQDLLYHFPRDYQDRSSIKAIAEVELDTSATIKGKILSVRLRPTWKGRSVLEVLVGDASGTITATWFNMPFIKEKFRTGEEVLLHGKIKRYRYLQMVNPEFEFLNKEKEDEPLSPSGIVPIYPVTEGINQGLFRRLVRRALEFVPYLEEALPGPLIEARHLLPLKEAIGEVHFPSSLESVKKARRRFAYEELFLFQTALALRRQRIKTERGNAFRIGLKVDEHIRRRFPFRLTQSQEKVLEEIRQDMQSPRPMNRLLQGDVGSGKTVVALYALLVAVANGFQAALMAPTEVLAGQHLHTLQRYLQKATLKMALLVGGRASKVRKDDLKAIREGEINLAIGTHALISRDVQFKNLGVVVVDEQHKFGVLQRDRLRQKGLMPDVLVMTATPIPRSLSLTLFGDLDISIIDEKPPGRSPVKTLWIPRRRLTEAYDLIHEEVKRGRQAFVVYPLVEDSEKLDLKSAQEGAERLQSIFPEFRVALLHGRMAPAQKDQIMGSFRDKKIDILVSTIVIEVGIDVPNATIMVIEHAERFGLAQLHQLRGRIGRGSEVSYFLLFADPKTPEARKRLEIITQTSDGFRIAEEDLKLRGPGEFFGTRQHGLPDFKAADLARDLPLLKAAREDAFKMIEADASLESFPLVKKRVLEKYKGRLRLVGVG